MINFNPDCALASYCGLKTDTEEEKENILSHLHAGARIETLKQITDVAPHACGKCPLVNQ